MRSTEESSDLAGMWSDLKRFVNVGAGSFYHSDWINLDKIGEFYEDEQVEGTIHWDLLDLIPLPFQDCSLDLVYSSHVIEHVTNQAAMNFFQEAQRVLVPGGGLRIRCPDVAKYFKAYRRGDLVGFAIRNYGKKDRVTHDEFLKLPPIKGTSQQQRLLWTFARQASIHHNRATNPLTDLEVDHLFASKLLGEALDECVSRCNLEIQQMRPEDHINWWTHNKLAWFLRRADFSKILRSSRENSIFPQMRRKCDFSEGNGISLYVDAVK